MSVHTLTYYTTPTLTSRTYYYPYTHHHVSAAVHEAPVLGTVATVSTWPLDPRLTHQVLANGLSPFAPLQQTTAPRQRHNLCKGKHKNTITVLDAGLFQLSVGRRFVPTECWTQACSNWVLDPGLFQLSVGRRLVPTECWTQACSNWVLDTGLFQLSVGSRFVPTECWIQVCSN